MVRGGGLILFLRGMDGLFGVVVVEAFCSGVGVHRYLGLLCCVIFGGFRG
jgi:hypothetical protein